MSAARTTLSSFVRWARARLGMTAGPQAQGPRPQSPSPADESRRVFIQGLAVALPAASLITLTPEELSTAPIRTRELQPHGLADIPDVLPSHDYRWIRMMLRNPGGGWEVDTDRMQSAKDAGWRMVICEGSTYTFKDLALCARPVANS